MADEPETVGSGTDEEAEYNSDMDVLDSATENDVKEEDVKEDVSEDVIEETDEEKESEEKSEEPEKEEKDELKEFEEEAARLGRPSFKDFTKEFPELVKKFPEFRDIYFREEAYSKVFPSVQDAQEASRKAEVYDRLDTDIVVNGNIEPLFGSLPESVIAQISSNVLPALAKRDKNLYTAAVAPAFQKALRIAYRNAPDSDEGKNLKNAALVLHQYLFNTDDLDHKIPDATSSPDFLEKRKAELDQRAEKEFQAKASEFFQEVNRTTFQVAFDSIYKLVDKDRVYPEKAVKRLVREILEEVDSDIAADNEYMSNRRKLEQRSAREGFNKTSKTRQINAYLVALKPRVSSAIKRAQLELAETHKRNRPVVQEKKFIPQNSSPGNGAVKAGPKSVDWKKTSDLDFLNDKVTFRKGR